MPIRQVQVVVCEVCRAEVVYESNVGRSTQGWIAVGTATMSVYGSGSNQNIGGQFCSVTCLTQWFRNQLEGSKANVAPVNYEDGESTE